MDASLIRVIAVIGARMVVPPNPIMVNLQVVPLVRRRESWRAFCDRVDNRAGRLNAHGRIQAENAFCIVLAPTRRGGGTSHFGVSDRLADFSG